MLCPTVPSRLTLNFLSFLVAFVLRPEGHQFSPSVTHNCGFGIGVPQKTIDYNTLCGLLYSSSPHYQD
jgi:hypothetical protein